MIDNLVTFATFLSKQGELNLKSLNLYLVIRECLKPFKSLAETKNLTIYTDISDVLPSIQGDEERLSDAIYHLVHNAIKFGEKDGSVWIRCRAVGNIIHFEVQDNGKGIPEDQLPTLWEGFAQMADPLLRGAEGLGLGLTLVKYVITAHGGEVWAKSKEGVGSAFGFNIPINKK